MYSRKRQILGLTLVFLILFSLLTPQVQSYLYLQEKQKLSVGDELEFFLKLPPLIQNTISIYIREGEKLLALEEGEMQNGTYSLGHSPVLLKPGQIELQLKLLGVIPLKRINVDVLPSIRLYPGGHSIGVVLRTEGVMVVGFSPVLDENNEPSFPARDSGIVIGDIVVEINGQKVASDDELKKAITAAGGNKITLTIKRGKQLIKQEVFPKYCNDTKSFRIGLFIRDNAGGVGTLTYYDAGTKKYGALGHVITDAETNQPIRIRQGKILYALVENVQKAEKGKPGEKVGLFQGSLALGTIEKNDNYGIYGFLHKVPENSLYKAPLPVAYANQVQTGKAKILTVIKGQEIKEFEISIEKIMYGRQDGKNMIIRIDDKELLEKTGGIVQGMSGSPIIQDNKIIGAITHVFVNNPSRGYGVFIENMLIEAGIIGSNEQTLGQKAGVFLVV